MKIEIDSWAWLPRESLRRAEEKKIQQTLTLVQKSGHPKAEPAVLRLYERRADRLGVPREFFRSHASGQHQIKWSVTEGRKDLSWPGRPMFDGKLRPAQKPVFQALRDHFEGGATGGILKASTGFGKTVLALSLVSWLDVPTLVLVQNEGLMAQWIERAREFIQDARVGRIQSDTCEFEGRHLTIAMIQSLIARQDSYPLQLWRWPGLVIADEVHRISAPTFSQIPPLFPAKYRLGLSATPRRKDGTENAFFWHIGPVVHRVSVPTMEPRIKRVWTRWKARHSPKRGGLGRMVTWMAEDRKRNMLIAQKLVEALKADRRVLVLSKRLAQLDQLEDLVRDLWSGAPPEIGRCVGGVRGEDLEEAKTKQLILATYQFAEEGFDVPELDTLFLATPKSDVQQATGRILRKHPDKKTPIVVDFRDDQVGVFKRWGKKREIFYRSICADKQRF